MEAQISVYSTSAPFKHDASELTSITAPVSLATSLALSITELSTCETSSAGPYATKCIPILAQPYIHAYDMLFLTSPTNTTFTLFRGLATCSSIVRRSASICVGWSTSVSPFHTGTPAYFARSSTTFCSYPLYSIPS